MTDFEITNTLGHVLDVTAKVLGSELVGDHAAGATTLIVNDAADFAEGGYVWQPDPADLESGQQFFRGGGLIRVGGDDPAAEVLRYESVIDPDDDDDIDDGDDWYEAAVGIGAGFGGEQEWVAEPAPEARDETDEEWDEDAEIAVGPGTITLAPGQALAQAWPEGTRVDMWDAGAQAPSTEWRALVRPAGQEDANDSIDAVLAFSVVPLLPQGVRGNQEAQELVSLDGSTGEWVVVNVVGKQPAIQGQMLSPGSVFPEALGFTVGSTQVTISATPPEDPNHGDIWYDAANGYQMMQYDAQAGVWGPRQWGNSALAAGAASRVSLASIPPEDPRESDLWIYVDTVGGMQMNRWDPQTADWVPLVFNTEAIAAAEIAAGRIQAGILHAFSIITGSLTGTVGGDPDSPTTIIDADLIPAPDRPGSGCRFRIDHNGGRIDIYQAITPTPTETVLTAASGTWTVPANVTQVTIECWGRGGGGGYHNQAGGGGGEYARRENMSVTPGQTYAYQVGTAAAGGTAGSPAAGGGITQFNVGAANGRPTTTANGGLGGGAGGSGSGAPIRFNGGSGIRAALLTNPLRGGGGGSSAGPTRAGRDATGYNGAGSVSGPSGAGGDGGLGGQTGANGSPGVIPGGGGGGRGRYGTSGGNGARGEIRLRWLTTDQVPPLVASISNAGIRVYRPDLIGFLGGYYHRVNLALNQTLTPSLLAGTPLTTLRNAQLISDFGNPWNYSTGVWTCPAPGLYEFTAGIVFPPGSWVAHSPIAIYLIANSTSRLDAFASFQTGSAADGQATVKGDRWCTTGDTVQVNARQASGTNQTIDGNAPGSFISIRRVV